MIVNLSLLHHIIQRPDHLGHPFSSSPSTRISTGKLAFSVAALRLWNSLLVTVHTTTSIPSFRSKLKNAVFQTCFSTLISSMTFHDWSNELMQWVTFVCIRHSAINVLLILTTICDIIRRLRLFVRDFQYLIAFVRRWKLLHHVLHHIWHTFRV